MGRSRGVPSTGDDDTNQRSKRRRLVSSGDALENISSGQGGGDGKKALYHCNYCNKDISGKIRIKCSKCPDFDLCVECFSIGAEVTPHKSNHPYRVMDNLSFPLVCSDWNADEEILLLEGIEMYGMGNWAEVAEHVGTKNKDQCIEHYNTAYMNSACYPLPDMSRVNGKNRKELLAMAKVQGDTKRGISMLGDTIVKAESPFSPSRIKLEDCIGDAATGRSPSHLTAGVSKKSLNVGQLKDASDLPKLEDVHVDRSIGVKKPKYSNEDGPSMAELSGFNSKREEFDPEYDNNAEVALAEMDFKDIDTETDREIKLRVLRIYLSRLNERKRRKDFIMERNLLYPNPMEMEMSSDEKELCDKYKPFMRYLPPGEHNALIRSVIQEQRTRKKIQELQDARSAGCRTLSEAKSFMDKKRKKEHLEALKANGGPKHPTQPKRPTNVAKSGGDSDSGSPRSTVLDAKKGQLDSPSGSGSSARSAWEDWDLTGIQGADLLSPAEHVICSRYHILPVHFLKMQEIMVQEIFKGTLLKQSDAHSLFNMEPAKVDRVYEMVIKKVGQPEESAVV